MYLCEILKTVSYVFVCLALKKIFLYVVIQKNPDVKASIIFHCVFNEWVYVYRLFLKSYKKLFAVLLYDDF